MMVTVMVLVLATASKYDPRAATARFLPVLACHPWWGVLLLVQYSRRSVGSLSMADMVHSTFLTNLIVCCACKIISSGVINIMEVLSMTNSRVLFPMVNSDLAIKLK